jgi:hypothetical protein
VKPLLDDKEQATIGKLQHKLEEQLSKVNTLLRAKVEKYDGYITSSS